MLIDGGRGKYTWGEVVLEAGPRGQFLQHKMLKKTFIWEKPNYAPSI